MKDPEKENAYKRLGSKLQEQLENSSKIAKAALRKSSLALEKKVLLLPEDLSNKVLGMKRDSELPETLLPASTFDKPRFLGKGRFYKRLASDVLHFGMAYQRSYGVVPTEEQVIEQFTSRKPWWECSEKDLQKSISALESSGIISRLSSGQILFEPEETSQDVSLLLKTVSENNLTKTATSPEDLAKITLLSVPRVTNLLEKLSKEGISIQDGDLYWFPGLSD